MELSIVIPVYNVAPYIRRCLKSIYSQNVSEDLFEVVIVDDETPDNSIEIAFDYLSDKTNFSVISQKNRGLGGARNTGLKNSSGRYVWFVDSDDEIVCNTLNKILDLLSGNMVDIFNFKYIKNNESIKDSVLSPAISEDNGIDMILKGKMLTTVWNNIYRRDYLIANSLFFKEKFKHEDGEFNMRACLMANRVDIVGFPIYNYYTNNGGSIMNNIGLQNQYDLMEYLSTADSLIKSNYKFGDKIFKACSKYIGLTLVMLFNQSRNLNSSDYVKYKEELKKQRHRYFKYIKYLPWRYRLLLSLKFYMSSIFNFQI